MLSSSRGSCTTKTGELAGARGVVELKIKTRRYPDRRRGCSYFCGRARALRTGEARAGGRPPLRLHHERRGARRVRRRWSSLNSETRRLIHQSVEVTALCNRVGPHHESHKRLTFNRFAGLGTLDSPENA